MTDGGAPDNEINRYGLLRTDGSQKPAYAAFRNVALNGDELTAPAATSPARRSPSTRRPPNQQFADHLL